MASSAGGRRQEQWPTDLDGFGFHFVKGQLRTKDTDEPFLFDYYPGDAERNQARYEALSAAVIEHVYELMEKESLQRFFVPTNARATQPRGFIFATADWQTNNRLLILIHGSGYVRAGLWARSLVINDSLDWGTQLPYIRRALQRGMAVLVMNTNLNKAVDSRGIKQYIHHSEAPDRHALYVWKEYVLKCSAKQICIVAHSAGGYVTVELAKHNAEDFAQRVCAVAFTDAAYSMSANSDNAGCTQLRKVGCDWVCSMEPLGRKVEWYRTSGAKLKMVSAGTQDHARSSHSAIDSIWQYLDEHLGIIEDLPAALPTSSASSSTGNRMKGARDERSEDDDEPNQSEKLLDEIDFDQSSVAAAADDDTNPIAPEHKQNGDNHLKRGLPRDNGVGVEPIREGSDQSAPGDNGVEVEPIVEGTDQSAPGDNGVEVEPIVEGTDQSAPGDNGVEVEPIVEGSGQSAPINANGSGEPPVKMQRFEDLMDSGLVGDPETMESNNNGNGVGIGE